MNSRSRQAAGLLLRRGLAATWQSEQQARTQPYPAGRPNARSCGLPHRGEAAECGLAWPQAAAPIRRFLVCASGGRGSGLLQAAARQAASAVRPALGAGLLPGQTRPVTVAALQPLDRRVLNNIFRSTARASDPSPSCAALSVGTTASMLLRRRRCCRPSASLPSTRSFRPLCLLTSFGRSSPYPNWLWAFSQLPHHLQLRAGAHAVFRRGTWISGSTPRGHPRAISFLLSSG